MSDLNRLSPYTSKQENLTAALATAAAFRFVFVLVTLTIEESYKTILVNKFNQSLMGEEAMTLRHPFLWIRTSTPWSPTSRSRNIIVILPVNADRFIVLLYRDSGNSLLLSVVTRLSRATYRILFLGIHFKFRIFTTIKCRICINVKY